MFSTIGPQDASLLTKSPKPGVSTTVRRRRTPFSSMSALIDWMETVLGMMSRLGGLRSFGGYKDVLKRVFTRVDLPSPDSPAYSISRSSSRTRDAIRTNYHDVKVEAFPDTLAVPLVWQVSKPNIAGQLPSHNVSHVTGGLCGGLGVFGRYSLRGRA